MKKMIYLDNASTTPVDEKIQNLIFDTIEKFGNPSNNYNIGHEAKNLIEKARKEIADAIGAEIGLDDLSRSLPIPNIL